MARIVPVGTSRAEFLVWPARVALRLQNQKGLTYLKGGFWRSTNLSSLYEADVMRLDKSSALTLYIAGFRVPGHLSAIRDRRLLAQLDFGTPIAAGREIAEFP